MPLILPSQFVPCTLGSSCHREMVRRVPIKQKRVSPEVSERAKEERGVSTAKWKITIALNGWLFVCLFFVFPRGRF